MISKKFIAPVHWCRDYSNNCRPGERLPGSRLSKARISTRSSAQHRPRTMPCLTEASMQTSKSFRIPDQGTPQSRLQRELPTRVGRSAAPCPARLFTFELATRFA
jgi:hypothetical protein